MDNLDDKNNEAPQDGNPQENADGAITPEQAQRYKEQATGSSQEAQRLRDMVIDAEYSKAEADGSSLLELHAKDPKLAEAVAKKFWYDSYDEASKSLNWDKEKSNDISLEDKFEELYKQRRAKEQHSEATEKVQAIFNKLWDQAEAVKTYYDMITEWKQLTPEKAVEFAQMATLYVNRENINKDSFNEKMADLASTGLGQQSSSKKEDKGSKTEEFAQWMFGKKFDHLFPNK